MKSAQGYYLGREVIEDETAMPYDRQSDYYKSEKAAIEALKAFGKEREHADNKSLPEIIKQHGEELENIISNELKEENGALYLNKEQIELMLENHFKRVENLIEFYSNHNDKKNMPVSEWIHDFENKLKNMANEFKDSIVSKILETKQNITDNIQQRTDAVRDQITEIKENIHNKIQNFVLGINQNIKDLAEKIDKKFENEKFTEVNKTLNKNNEIHQLKQEIANLKNENKMMLEENKKLASGNLGHMAIIKNKLDTLEQFFSTNKAAREGLNDFLTKQTEPKQENQELEKQKVSVSSKKSEDFDL